MNGLVIMVGCSKGLSCSSVVEHLQSNPASNVLVEDVKPHRSKVLFDLLSATSKVYWNIT